MLCVAMRYGVAGLSEEIVISAVASQRQSQVCKKQTCLSVFLSLGERKSRWAAVETKRSSALACVLVIGRAARLADVVPTGSWLVSTDE